MGQESSSGRLQSSVRREKDIDLDIDSRSVLKDYKEVERPQYNTSDSSVFLLKLGSNFGGYETTGMTRRIVGVFSEDHTTEPHVSRTSGVADPRELELRQMTEEESSGKLNLACHVASGTQSKSLLRSTSSFYPLHETSSSVFLHVSQDARRTTVKINSFKYNMK
ncbi:hypothetical protein HZH66_002369 [Vespula vulgaris]|uniref:Uncharacterized protein n=1 Tax=Vespula vulgaris TaxID=7454 RepID=A0A834KKZ3_VESVU|nr:hypothetical protein HZH66_002369 [Vespula vulgaris]